MERNAARAGLVERAEDWPHGALFRRARGETKILTPWPVPPPRDYLRWVNEPLTERELEAVRRDRSLIPRAMEEGLRWETPLTGIGRLCTEDTEVCGVRVPKGAMVQVSLGAANRDTEAFAEPDRLMITRDPNRHLAFGMGIHYCLGAPLAVAEAQVAFETLLRRYPAPALAAEPKWGASFILRGLKTLEITSPVAATR